MAEAKQNAITLILTPKEASVLYKILGKVGGDPDGPRGHSDRIRRGLEGVQFPRIPPDSLDWCGSIRCPDHPKTAAAKRNRMQKNVDIVSALRAELPTLDKFVSARPVTQNQRVARSCVNRLMEVLDD